MRAAADTISEGGRLGLRLPPLRAGFLPLSMFGAGVAAYLTYVHLRGVPPLCGGFGGCETVQSSKWSELAGVPVATLGLAMYVSVFVLTAAGLLRPALAGWASLAVFGMALGGVLYSAYLTYLELWVIDAICVWCVISAVTVTIIFVLSAWVLLKPPANSLPTASA